VERTNAASVAGAQERSTTRGRVAQFVVLTVGCYVALSAVWVGLGFLVTKPLAQTWLGTVDQHVATWLVGTRTPQLDDLSFIGSMLAQTLVKVLVTVIFAGVCGYALRSWRAPLFIVLATVVEGAVFITVTWIVARPRPGVALLDDVTVNSSFPSGHVGAAAAYAAVAVVILEHTRTAWVRAAAVILAFAVPLIVGWARMYRGAHYLTDVVAGLMLGLACVIASYLVVERCFGRQRGDQLTDTGPPPTRSTP